MICFSQSESAVLEILIANIIARSERISLWTLRTPTVRLSGLVTKTGQLRDKLKHTTDERRRMKVALKDKTKVAQDPKTCRDWRIWRWLMVKALFRGIGNGRWRVQQMLLRMGRHRAARENKRSMTLSGQCSDGHRATQTARCRHMSPGPLIFDVGSVRVSNRIVLQCVPVCHPMRWWDGPQSQGFRNVEKDLSQKSLKRGLKESFQIVLNSLKGYKRL